MPNFVYILRCADGSYYTGITHDSSVDRRVSEHNNGHYPDAWTARRRPVTLVFAEEFTSIRYAIDAERRLKDWSRAKKEALIRGDWQGVQWWAKRPTARVSRLAKGASTST
jgi:putative endonuclease